MTKDEHEDLCVYLESWLQIYYSKKPQPGEVTYSKWLKQRPYASLVDSTLADLLIISAEEAGL